MCPRPPGWRRDRIRLLQRREAAVDSLGRAAPRGRAAGHQGAHRGARAFRTRAYAGFADQPIPENIPDYLPMLESVRSSFAGQDGKQPGDPHRAAAAVIAATNRADPPHLLILGGAAYDKVVNHWQARLDAARMYMAISRSADFPPNREALP